MGWLNCDRKSKQLRLEPRLASDIRHRGTGSCIPMGRRRGRGGLRKVLDCFLASTFHTFPSRFATSRIVTEAGGDSVAASQQ